LPLSSLGNFVALRAHYRPFAPACCRPATTDSQSDYHGSKDNQWVGGINAEMVMNFQAKIARMAERIAPTANEVKFCLPTIRSSQHLTHPQLKSLMDVASQY
jgi:hypothetical protein